jgi:hypothetical protein
VRTIGIATVQFLALRADARPPRYSLCAWRSIRWSAPIVDAALGLIEDVACDVDSVDANLAGVSAAPVV